MSNDAPLAAPFRREQQRPGRKPQRRAAPADLVNHLHRSALEDYGDAEDKEGLIAVKDSSDDEVDTDARPQTVEIAATADQVLEFPQIIATPVEPDLDFDVSHASRTGARLATEFGLGDTAKMGSSEALQYPYETFVRLVTSRVLTNLSYLSEPLHRASVMKLAESIVDGIGVAKGDEVGFDWQLVAEALSDQIDKQYRRSEAKFELSRPRKVPEDVLDRLRHDRESGRSFRAIADALNAEGIPTAHGGAEWWPATVQRILRAEYASS